MWKASIILISTILLGACTDPGQTTAVGAAAGGAVGAGLGAIVGNQTGDAGTGLAIGMLAGAGTGGAIGNALEAQEKTVRSQDEALERQERMIAAQRAEIDELRKLSQDGLSYKGSTGEGIEKAGGQPYGQPTTPHYSSLPVDDPTNSPRGAYKWGNEPPAETEDATSRSAQATTTNPADCRQAEGEVRTAKAKPSLSDKLFHYRRALRLCPDNATFHNGLGEVYAAMQRKEDAEFEFREALRLDPAFGLAEANLKSLPR